MKYRTFWHCTPFYNLDSVIEKGLDPSYAKSDRKLVWFCEWRGLPHMLAHVSARHSIPVTQLVVIRIRVKEGDYTHHRLTMWYSVSVQRRGMKVLAGDKALARWEAQRATARSMASHYAKRK